MVLSFSGLCLFLGASVALAGPVLSGEPAGFDATPGWDAPRRNHVPTDTFMKLLPLHRVKTAPGPYDWLALHPEAGQDFNDYVSSGPVLPDDLHRVIYIILIGDFDEERKRIIEETAEFIEAYFTLPVKFLPPVGVDVVPAAARRTHPQTQDRQILTTYIIESVLKPLKPEDAFCLIGFAAEDLWPGEGWNFVFGQASLPDRVGIWSIYRNGNPHEGVEARKLCLLRTIKTGIHEIGHMFSMHHCVFFECNMNGSNHRRESDARPVWLCPVCLRKLIWGLSKDPVARFEALLDVCARLGLEEERAFFHDSLKVLTAPE
jgi:archaemetzincin